MTLSVATAWPRSEHGVSWTSLSAWCGRTLGGTTAALTWPSGDLAIYLPIRIQQPVLVRRMFYVPDTSATGNIDIGLYDAAGTRLVSSGSTAKSSSSNSEAVVDVTDVTISGGLYYLAMVSSNNTDTFFGASFTAPHCAAWGVLSEQLGATTLPTTATWAVDQTLTLMPQCGVLLEATIT